MLRNIGFRVILAISVSAATVCANAEVAPEVKIGPAPKWVLPNSESPESSVPTEALISISHNDTQVRVSRKGTETYIAQRYKLLKPEALQAANLNFGWQSGNGEAVVHAINIIRADGTISDMLGKSRFRIVQREEQLEQAILTGLTTAVFNTPGVEIGDEIEFSVTLTHRDPTLGDRAIGVVQLPLVEIGGLHRARIVRADSIPLKWRLTPDLQARGVKTAETQDEVRVELSNPKSPMIPTGAPARFGVRRLVEYSGFSDWPEVSRTFWPLFDRASALAADSPIRNEAAKIASLSNDPLKRTLAAVKLVQDRVRYVYVGLGTGNYTPATAGETWERRYGDCKGKTALLLALLRELDIPAEAVLVNTSGGDGIGERLASPASFNHIVVRAQIAGKSYWLDGTLHSSPELEFIPEPPFRSALALSRDGKDLETLTIKPLEAPALLGLIEIDATAGRDKPAKVAFRRMFRGAEVPTMRAALAALAGEEKKQVFRNVFADSSSAFEMADNSWSYDERTGVLTMAASGTDTLDWEGDGPADRTLTLPKAGFYPPNAMKRPNGQEQNVPWAVEFPFFDCWISRIHLPNPEKGWVWTYMSKPMDRALAGMSYFRQSTINGSVVQTVRSKRALTPELSADEVAEVQKAIPDFDNATSYVYQSRVGRDAGSNDDPGKVLDLKAIDWESSAKICQARPTRNL